MRYMFDYERASNIISRCCEIFGANNFEYQKEDQYLIVSYNGISAKFSCYRLI